MKKSLLGLLLLISAGMANTILGGIFGPASIKMKVLEAAGDFQRAKTLAQRSGNTLFSVESNISQDLTLTITADNGKQITRNIPANTKKFFTFQGKGRCITSYENSGFKKETPTAPLCGSREFKLERLRDRAILRVVQ